MKTFQMEKQETKSDIPSEYFNPFNKQPIQSIEVCHALIKELDNWLDPFEHQLRIVRRCIEEAEKKSPTTKSYMETLADKKYPRDKMYEALALARAPGNNRTLKIATHPVIVDGEVMDFADLEAFWKSQRLYEKLLSYFWDMSWHGYNPVTCKKIKTMTYHGELKSQTAHFMSTLILHRAFATEQDVQCSNYRFNLFSITRFNPLTEPEESVNALKCSTPSKKLM
jgi:hypothetical protein